MDLYPLKLQAIPKERIWGGDQLKNQFKEKSNQTIGEYWVLSEHPNGVSKVVNGKFAGKTLVELTNNYPEAYLGESPQDRFPLLIKFIDAKQDLSVQIHPDDAYSQRVEGDYGKTEAWYILDCKQGSSVIYGHDFKDPSDYKNAVDQKKVKEFLKYEPIKPEDLVFVPSRTLHALLGGTTLIEIQQTSDVTYRVYDWDRVDEQGNERELHIDKSADVMSYGESMSLRDMEKEKRTIAKTENVHHDHLLTCPYFVIETLMIESGSYKLDLGKSTNPDILIVAEGEGELQYEGGKEHITLGFGDTVLIPSTIKDYEIGTKGKLKLIRTYY